MLQHDTNSVGSVSQSHVHVGLVEGPDVRATEASRALTTRKVKMQRCVSSAMRETTDSSRRSHIFIVYRTPKTYNYKVYPEFCLTKLA